MAFCFFIQSVVCRHTMAKDGFLEKKCWRRYQTSTNGGSGGWTSSQLCPNDNETFGWWFALRNVCPRSLLVLLLLAQACLKYSRGLM